MRNFHIPAIWVIRNILKGQSQSSQMKLSTICLCLFGTIQMLCIRIEYLKKHFRANYNCGIIFNMQTNKSLFELWKSHCTAKWAKCCIKWWMLIIPIWAYIIYFDWMKWRLGAIWISLPSVKTFRFNFVSESIKMGHK